MSTHKFTLLLFTLLIITSGHTANAQRVTVTLAGTGIAGYTGDGQLGKLAALNRPHDVCMDAANNIYFTDQGNGVVRKVSAKNGIITTVAGGGMSTADGIPATNAVLTPKYMCIDGTGNLYVVSSATNQIKRIDAVTNFITTIAGTGASGFSGDFGLSVTATFNGILGICIDHMNNIYVVDSGNKRIRKISATGIVTTVAGTGTAGYTGDGGPAAAATINTPSAITVNPAGDVFFMDQSAAYTSVLRKISAATGFISTVAGIPTVGGGPVFGSTFTTTWLGYVTGLCMDGSGNFYCNEISCSCRKLDVTTDSSYNVGGDFSVEAYADNLTSNIAYMNNPYGICVDATKSVYVADKFNNRIRKIIQLTHTPTFAYGKGTYLYMCPGNTVSFDSLLAITDLDGAQTETYTIVTPPLHGTVSGFPATATSVGTTGIARPGSMSYTGMSTYSGSDSFQVQVSDGALSSTFTVYIDAGIGSIAGPDVVCTGSAISLSDEVGNGTWTMANTNAAVSASGIVTAATVGSDIVSYSVTNSCGTLTSAKTITISTLPDAGIITGATSVCKGASIWLSDAAASGVWSTSNSSKY